MGQVDREALRGLLKSRGKSARAVSLAAGLGATAVKDILSGKSRDPGAGTLAAVAGVLGVMVADLMVERAPFDDGASTKVKLAPRFLGVRYRVQAGHWFEIETDEPPEQVQLAVLPDPRYAAFPQWLEKVVGDSVNLKIAPGKYVHVVDAIELGYAPRHGDWVVVERRRDQGAIRERSIKQVEIRNGKVLLCPRSTNPKWREPLDVSCAPRPETIEVEIVGKVIGAYDADF